MDGRQGVVLQMDGEFEIRFERRLDHPVEKVWDAITGPGQMSGWFDRTQMPDPLKVGAVIRFRHEVINAESYGQITELDPPHLIEWLWRGPFGPASRMRWEIAPLETGCLLVLRQQMVDSAVLARTTAGWHDCLDRMQALLEGREAQFDMAEWRGLFERYAGALPAAGVTTPQAGPPNAPPPTS